MVLLNRWREIEKETDFGRFYAVCDVKLESSDLDLFEDHGWWFVCESDYFYYFRRRWPWLGQVNDRFF